MRLSEFGYEIACNEHLGYCRTCDKINDYDGVEPDAHGLKCHECFKETVYGIEEALIMGFISIEGE